MSGCQVFGLGVLSGNTRQFLWGDGTVLCPDCGDSYMNFTKL